MAKNKPFDVSADLKSPRHETAESEPEFCVGIADAPSIREFREHGHAEPRGMMEFSREAFKQMKMVTAYVRTQCTPALMRALHEAGVGGLTAYVVRGMSGEASTFLYSKRPFELNHLPESLKIELICDDDSVANIVSLITQQARTGSPGDGIVAIQNLERVLKIREIA